MNPSRHPAFAPLLRPLWPPKSSSDLRAPRAWLFYLGWLFLPVLGGGGTQWLLPTLLTLPLFLFLYLRGQRHASAAGVAETAGIVLLGLALTPYNWFANTYFAYASGFLPYLIRGLAPSLLAMLGIVALQAAEILLLHQPPLLIAINLLVSAGSCAGNYFYVENRRKNRQLQISNDEVRRLAATAERERIGRDLHDLLGHTLSLIAVKLDLADRLADRDPAASRRELRDAREVAREALSQVRSAVTGIRSGGLAAELASSRVLLESSKMSFSCERVELELPAELESAAAMILREAITNVQRHSRARQVTVRIHASDGELAIEVGDDGVGGIRTEGNGLTGMRERIGALGGSLSIDSPRGGGTRLHIRLPLQARLGAAA